MSDDAAAARHRRQDVWTRHWSSGASHSCAGSYDGATYGGAIASFWQSLHATTRPGSRVLDIATGRGALPVLLLRARPDLELHIDAVDIAQIDTASLLGSLGPTPRATLRFHAPVAAESLPFDDRRFDLVVSQYGLEYAELGAAVPEMLRVRAPQGRIGLVMHHRGSRPVALAATEIDHIDWLRGDDGLLSAVVDMLAPLALAATAEGRARLSGDESAEAARLRFNASQDASIARANAAPDGADVLHETHDAVAGIVEMALHQGEAAAREAWHRLDRGLADSRWRLSELRHCALDGASVRAPVAQMQAAGLTVTCQELLEGPHLMGWCLVAH